MQDLLTPKGTVSSFIQGRYFSGSFKNTCEIFMIMTGIWKHCSVYTAILLIIHVIVALLLHGHGWKDCHISVSFSHRIQLHVPFAFYQSSDWPAPHDSALMTHPGLAKKSGRRFPSVPFFGIGKIFALNTLRLGWLSNLILFI